VTGMSISGRRCERWSSGGTAARSKLKRSYFHRRDGFNEARLRLTWAGSTGGRRLSGPASFQQTQFVLRYGKLRVATIQANHQRREEPHMWSIEVFQARKMDGYLCGKSAS